MSPPVDAAPDAEDHGNPDSDSASNAHGNLTECRQLVDSLPTSLAAASQFAVLPPAQIASQRPDI